jgi:SAM-dependent methyltransferase
MHLNSALLFSKYAKRHIPDDARVLEIGPAGIPSEYQKLANIQGGTWHFIDFPDTRYIDASTSKLTYTLQNAYQFPVPDDEYDVVLSGQVIEHVQKPWLWLGELKRVVRPNGLIITINPVSWPYHEAPIDCWRIYPSGVEGLAEEHGLDVEFCVCESLEAERLRDDRVRGPLIPGRSYNAPEIASHTNFAIRWNRWAGALPFVGSRLLFPVEVSYDVISVLRKKSPQGLRAARTPTVSSWTSRNSNGVGESPTARSKIARHSSS